MPGRLRRTFHTVGLIPRSRRLRTLARLAEMLPTRDNHVTIYHDGDALYDAMLRDIAAARTRISIEIYIFQHDSVGREFARALGERAAAGIPVRIIYDAVGSFSTSYEFWRGLQQSGVSLLEYHPVQPWRKRFALFRRDHRKILVIDGRIGYAGGVNFGLAWAGPKRGGEAWRDTHARVAGPAAGDLEVLFQETWFRESGELLELPRALPRERPRPSTPVSVTVPGGDEVIALAVANPTPGVAEHGSAQVAVVSSAGARHRHIRTLYLRALREARQSVSIAISYFMPDRAFRRALARAALRGVKVRLLLPLRSDVQWVEWCGRAFYARLLKRGIELYQWKPGILHTKTVVIDRGWSMVGSSNLDHFSFKVNLEANLVIFDDRVGIGLEEQFDRDIQQAHKIDFEEWQKRPLRERLKELMAVLLRPWL